MHENMRGNFESRNQKALSSVMRTCPELIERPMYQELKIKKTDLEGLCRLHRVKRLYIFGSALRDDFDPENSDLDFLVQFEQIPPADYANAYFSLLEELQELFQKAVDLVTETSLKNPWRRQEIERNREPLYSA